MTARIDRLWPDPADQLDDDELTLFAAIARRCGSTSCPASMAQRPATDALADCPGPADKRLFELLRRACDVVLVGAGTVRVEGYGAMRVSDASARWRAAHGLARASGVRDRERPPRPRPGVARSSRMRRCGRSCSPARMRPAWRPSMALADVIRVGGTHVDVPAMLAALHERGLTQVLCEGGPTLVRFVPRSGRCRRAAPHRLADPAGVAMRAAIAAGDRRTAVTCGWAGCCARATP